MLHQQSVQQSVCLSSNEEHSDHTSLVEGYRSPPENVVHAVFSIQVNLGLPTYKEGEKVLPLSITMVELLSCWSGSADGWFDDPIGLSARAYILMSWNTHGKSLLVRHYLTPWSNFYPISKAYTSSPHWPLLSMTKPCSHAPLLNIRAPPQQAYVSLFDWMPQSQSFVILVLFLLWTNNLLTNPWSLCSIYRSVVIQVSCPTAWTPSLFFCMARCVSRITHWPALLLRRYF